MVVRRLILLFSVLCFIRSETDHQHIDFVLCRLCGYSIAPASHIINVVSPAAEEVTNQTIFGFQEVQVQTLVNPFGINFDVIISAGGTCVGRRQRWKSEDSWFPGYLWKPCFCSRCNNQVGWIFEPLNTAHDDRAYASKNGFYALNLDTIISEDFSDSLIATPIVSNRPKGHSEL